MANLDSLRWRAIEHASKEYMEHLPRIEEIRDDIEKLKNGLKKLSDISNNEERIRARKARERISLQEVESNVELALERVMERPDFQEACILDRLKNYANTVGRVMLGNGYGTGWLLGKNLMITNNHVLPDQETARNAMLNMGYEKSVQGRLQEGHNFRFRPDLFFMTPDKNRDEFLDFTIVAVEPVSTDGVDLAHYGYVMLDGSLGKVLEGENCMVIQHPKGEYKKVVLRDIRLLMIEDQPDADLHVFYQSDTQPGSSGSPVVALGTGEIIALHNAGVPKRNTEGDYLKKNGQVFDHRRDDEEDLEWIANQGVRVSRIVRAIKTLPLPASMEAIRRQLMEEMDSRQLSVVTADDMGNAPAATSGPVSLPQSPDPNPGRDRRFGGANRSSPTSSQPASGGGEAHSFIVKIKSGPFNMDFATQILKRHFPAALMEPLSTEPESPLKDFLYITLNTSSPWQTAAQLESLEVVEEADPDLPQFTATGGPEENIRPDAAKAPNPFDPAESFNKAKARVKDFEKWPASPYLTGRNADDPDDQKLLRRWNHEAIKFEADKVRESLEANGQAELRAIRIAHFDTGFTDHSKVKNGFDLEHDYDTVSDDEDARDEGGKILVHFEHGTRTGSLIIGNEDSSVDDALDGNIGMIRAVLDDADFRITPFRVTKNVILVGRIREVIRAAEKAISGGYDVITMSLGILPGWNWAFKRVVREAYERGIIWCSAAGNQVKLVVAPAKFPGTIAVAASNPNNETWKGSCRGKMVDITAPGEDVYVPTRNDQGREDMIYGNGTSYATPHVASAAALWLAKHRAALNGKYKSGWQKVEAFRHCLKESADKSHPLAPNTGAGLLNLQALLEMELPPAENLRHRYLDSHESFTEGTNLAVREQVYYDWSTIYSQDSKEAPQYKEMLTESFGQSRGGRTRPETEAFTQIFDGDKSNGFSTQESSRRVDNSPEAAFRRLQMLYDDNSPVTNETF